MLLFAILKYPRNRSSEWLIAINLSEDCCTSVTRVRSLQTFLACVNLSRVLIIWSAGEIVWIIGRIMEGFNENWIIFELFYSPFVTTAKYVFTSSKYLVTSVYIFTSVSYFTNTIAIVNSNCLREKEILDDRYNYNVNIIINSINWTR